MYRNRRIQESGRLQATAVATYTTQNALVHSVLRAGRKVRLAQQPPTHLHHHTRLCAALSLVPSGRERASHVGGPPKQGGGGCRLARSGSLSSIHDHHHHQQDDHHHHHQQQDDHHHHHPTPHHHYYLDSRQPSSSASATHERTSGQGSSAEIKNGYLIKYLAMTQVVLYMDGGILPSLLSQLRPWFRLSFLQQGLLGGFMFFTLAMACPVASMMYRRYPSKAVLVWSFGACVVSNLIFTHAAGV